MTREQAINSMISHGFTVEQVGEIIKVITPQEPVLDKIRAEIVELTKCPYGTECLGANCPSNTDCMICGELVLEIIDEYKEDKVVEDGNDDR